MFCTRYEKPANNPCINRRKILMTSVRRDVIVEPLMLYPVKYNRWTHVTCATNVRGERTAGREFYRLQILQDFKL